MPDTPMNKEEQDILSGLKELSIYLHKLYI